MCRQRLTFRRTKICWIWSKMSLFINRNVFCVMLSCSAELKLRITFIANTSWNWRKCFLKKLVVWFHFTKSIFLGLKKIMSWTYWLQGVVKCPTRLKKELQMKLKMAPISKWLQPKIPQMISLISKEQSLCYKKTELKRKVWWIFGVYFISRIPQIAVNFSPFLVLSLILDWKIQHLLCF